MYLYLIDDDVCMYIYLIDDDIDFSSFPISIPQSLF